MYVNKKKIDRKDKVYLQREYESGNRRELENKMKIGEWKWIWAMFGLLLYYRWIEMVVYHDWAAHKPVMSTHDMFWLYHYL